MQILNHRADINSYKKIKMKTIGIYWLNSLNKRIDFFIFIQINLIDVISLFV